MACNKKIVASISNACRSIKGLKPKLWAFNTDDFTFNMTNNTVTSIVKIGSVIAYTVDGYRDFANAGHEAKVAENMPTCYVHKLALNLALATAAERLNVDNTDKISIVVEANDGSLLCYAPKYGMWKTTQTQMANDNNGQITTEFASREGMEEDYSVYFYTGTKASLVALES